jgi:hypothetical protein
LNAEAISLSRLLRLIVATAGGAIGWWLGAHIGVMTAFLVSVAGTGLGVYVGGRIARHYLP